MPRKSSGNVDDITDRAARVVGAVSPVAGSTWDVSDRAARLAGKVGIQVGGADVSGANAVPITIGAPTKNVQIGAAVATATTGAKKTWTAGANGGRVTLISASAGTGVTLQVRVTRGGVTVVVTTTGSGAALIMSQLNMELGSGDTVDINVSVAGVGTTSDMLILGVDY